MAKFCDRCGKPLSDGQICSCQYQSTQSGMSNPMDFNNPQPFNTGQYTGQQQNTNQGPYENTEYYNPNDSSLQQQANQQQARSTESSNITIKLPGFTLPKFDFSSPRNFFASMKDNMGIGDPETNRDKCYEEDMYIVPDNLCANDGEIPVKQYRFAILRTKMSFMKAKGRLQITNKRLIFRAPGRSLIGRTMLQNEFDINQIHGVRIQKGYRFSFGNLFLSIMLILLCTGIASVIVGMSEGLAIFTAILFSLIGIYSFFCMKKHFLLKTVLSSAALATFAMCYVEIENKFLFVLAAVFLIFTIISITLYCWCQDLQFMVDTSSGTPAMVISRERGSGIFGLFGHHKQETTGYREVAPDVDADRAIREINTIISDLQTMGDLAVDKWKE